MVNYSQLRTAITKCLDQNPANVVRAIKSSGVPLTQQEEKTLQTGSVEGFSDQQLSKCFTAKTLGELGIDAMTQGQVGGVTRPVTHAMKGQTQGQAYEKRSKNS